MNEVTASGLAPSKEIALCRASGKLLQANSPEKSDDESLFGELPIKSTPSGIASWNLSALT
jgi:hypothetical protein